MQMVQMLFMGIVYLVFINKSTLLGVQHGC